MPGARASTRSTPTTRSLGARLAPLFYPLLAVNGVMFVVALQLVSRAPIERTMGIVQKIFYFHVPSAISMYYGAAACFVGSLGYLLRPREVWDALGRAGAEVAVVFGGIMLVTGPLWAAKAWGHYWTWDPRLTTALLSELIYVAYLVLRAFAGDGAAERRFAAALGVLGAANLPIIHYAVQKWGGQHPVVTGKGGGGIDPSMKPAFDLSMWSFTLLVALLLWARVRVELAKHRLATSEEDAVDLGLDSRTES
jgi:heme exporter protein C